MEGNHNIGYSNPLGPVRLSIFQTTAEDSYRVIADLLNV